jgi:hypothetical protein
VEQFVIGCFARVGQAAKGFREVFRRDENAIRSSYEEEEDSPQRHRGHGGGTEKNQQLGKVFLCVNSVLSPVSVVNRAHQILNLTFMRL